MDIAGAKALKERLGHERTDEAPSASADVPEDAPPVYRWVGVPGRVPDTPDSEDESRTTNTSLFRRLGLSFR